LEEPLEIPDPEFQALSMETHAQHLHKAPGNGWKHYFFEFFMLFLAVFCGFLAENFREHYVEKEKARQYIESLYDDLKNDTARIAGNAAFDGRKIEVLGMLNDCYDAILKNTRYNDCLLNIIQQTATNRPFIRTDRTLKELANAGGFRLLNQEDADSIISYEDDWNNFEDFQSTVYQNVQNTVRSSINEVYNFKANTQMFKPESGKIINGENLDKTDVTAPLLFSADKNLLNKYFNELQLYFRVTYNHKRMLLDLKDKQARLIGYFRKKYGYE